MYYILLLFILAVSSIDQYCLINFVTYEDELNPLGKLLIYLGGVPLFACAKAGGTAVVAWLLIKFRKSSWAFTIVATIAMFQLWLLYFMLS